MIDSQIKALTAKDVRAAIHFENPPRPPRLQTLWHSQETLDYYGQEFVELQARYPDDICVVDIAIEYWNAPADDPDYRWAFNGKKEDVSAAVDAKPVIEDFSELGDFIAQMPRTDRAEAFDRVARCRQENPDSYILECWGHYFHQRIACLRGIENLLYDFYDHPDELRRLMDAFLDFYSVWAKRAARAGANGVWAGDDLGTQISLFMPPDTFRSLYKPVYKKFAEILHSNGLDFWLHTCGNVTEILDDLIEVGVDVIHPIQVGAMDAEQVASKYAGKVAFWVGMDVQNLIPFGSPEEIRRGVRKRAETFYRPAGGVIYGAGNSLVPNIPIENIAAYAGSLFDFCQEKI
jgi:hypothetical protein